MANWTSLSVRNVITKIKDSEIVLPVIQRRLVWEEDKMELLFDTLLKCNSFGSVICIEEEKDTKPLFAFRLFTVDGRDLASTETDELSKTQWFIIDGQQRLQSFYIGLIGTYNGKRMYFDLYSDYDEGEFDFRFATKPENLPNVNKERSDSAVRECFWYPVEWLYTRLNATNDDDPVSEEIIKKHTIENTRHIKHIEKNVTYFYKGIFNAQSIGMSKVFVNKNKGEVENRQRIVELFRRLNDGGTKLSSYDLVASMLKSFDYRMEYFLDAIVSEYHDIGFDQDALIKLLLILNDKPSKEITDLAAVDAEFATSNSDRIKATLMALRKFLIATSHINWFTPSKNRSAIPLYFLAYHIFHSSTETSLLGHLFDRFDTNDKNFHDMAVWLRLSLLNKVFSRGCGWIPYKTGITKIHAVMKASKGAQFPMNALLEVYQKHPLRFAANVTYENIDTFDQEFIFHLLYKGLPSIRNEDIDHIHPRSILSALGLEELTINSIANLQLLDSGTNRGKKNDKELEVWINNGVAPENKQDYLQRHLIPSDCALWKSSKFEEFIRERTKMLVKQIRENL